VCGAKGQKQVGEEGRGYTSETMQQEKKDETKKKQRIYVPAYFSKKACFEAIQLDGREVFLTHEQGYFDTFDVLELSEIDEAWPVQFTKPYVFHDIPREAKPLTELFEELHEVWSTYFAHPDERVIEFLTLFDLYSYMASKGPGCIQVFLIGGIRTGKNTAQIIAEETGYRAFGGVDPSEAAIYRILGYKVQYGPLIILKEYERASPVMKQISRESDIPGSTVLRADKENDSFTVHGYYVYGPRLAGANRLPTFNDADIDRIHTIKTVRAKPVRPRAELNISNEVKEKLQRLRNELLAWRVKNYADFEFPVQDPKDQFEGRDWEHYCGIITLASMVNNELEDRIRQYIADVLEEVSEDSKSSLEGIVARAVIDLSEEERFKTPDGMQVPFTEIWNKLQSMCTPVFENGIEAAAKLISPDGRILTTTNAGKLLKEQLYAKKVTWWDSKVARTTRGYAWSKNELNLIKRLTGLTGLTGFKPLETPPDDKSQNHETQKDQEPEPPSNTPKTCKTGKTCKEEPDPVTEPEMRPQRCLNPEVCGYYGVFLYVKDFEEHLQKLHGGVKE
jgi:predicted small lipoprotein YifL